MRSWRIKKLQSVGPTLYWSWDGDWTATIEDAAIYTTDEAARLRLRQLRNHRLYAIEAHNICFDFIAPAAA